MTESSLQIQEMSYVERAIYRYLKGLVAGLDILWKRKYRAYSLTIFIVALLTSGALILNGIVPDLIPQEYMESLLATEVIFALAALLSFLVLAPFLRRTPFLAYVGTLIVFGILFIAVFLDYLDPDSLFFLARLAFWSWMIFLSASFLGFIRSFFTEWYGAIIWAGNPEGRILFSPIIRLFILISVILPIYAGYKALTDPLWTLIAASAALSLILVLIAVFIIPRKEKGNIFGTILSFFYIYSLYHGFTSFIRDVNSPVLLVDTLLLFIGAVYSVQATSRRATQFKNPLLRKIGEERWVFAILALGLGYHVTSLYTAIQEDTTDIISSFHLGSFIVSSIIILFVMVFYVTSRRFRAWAVDMPTTSGAVKSLLAIYGPQAVGMLFTALAGFSRDKLGDVTRAVPASFQGVGRRIFEWLADKAQKRMEDD